MKYVCTLLTPDFKEKYDEWLDKYLSSVSGQEKFLQVKNFTFLTLMYWSGSIKGNGIDRVLPNHLLKPETVVRKFDPVEDVFSTYPRIEWNGKKRKIEDIPEVIGYHIEI